MHKLIKELAEQAGMFIVDDQFSSGGRFAAKFAELIINECLAECWYDATPKQISNNIKIKFGVEE